MGKTPCCEKNGLKKGVWTPEEDKKLLDYINRHGHGSWRALPAKAGLQRCGKSCRLRWRNYLRPDIKRGKFSREEEQTIIQLHALVGNRWSVIANLLPKRTDNEIKNYWNTHLKKRLITMGIDPVTHKPKSNDALFSGQSKDITNLNHIAQWESARVEAEARLVRDSKQLMSNPYHLTITSGAQLLNKAALVPFPLITPCLDILKARQWVSTNPNPAFPKFNVGNLESSISSLHFPASMFTVPSTNGFGENSFFRANDKIENLKPQEMEITKEKANDMMEGTMPLLEVESFPVDEASIANTSAVPSFWEGITGDLLWDGAEVFNITGLYNNNIGSFCSGNLEDNSKYWN